MSTKPSLVPIRALKSPVEVPLSRALPIYRSIVGTGVVDQPVIAESSSMIVLGGFEVLRALELLAADLAPTIEVDLSDVEAEPSSLSRIARAALLGPKLAPEEVNVRFRRELPRISPVELERLRLPEEQSPRLRLRVYESTLELLYRGWPTPLVRLRSLSSGEVQAWAKLECYNPFSNSVKDRIGWSMMMRALREGTLRGALYEATSTNTGIALTAIGNVLGARVKLFIPQTIQRASDVFLRVLGADVVRVPVNLTIEAVREVEEVSKRDGAVHLNQFENDANLEVHLKQTARELDEQLASVGLRPTHVIGGIGTSGHMSALALYFKSKYRDVKVVGVQPAVGETIPGIRRKETGMKWIHWVEFDEIVDVTQAEAIEGALRVARGDGLIVGLSSGAVVKAFEEVSRRDGPGAYVLIFPDSGFKYVEYFERHFTARERAPAGLC
ncbi:MAG: pyridoxal-phosphate dependent enzyme [Fervidicoccaceae archaeon]